MFHVWSRVWNKDKPSSKVSRFVHANLADALASAEAQRAADHSPQMQWGVRCDPAEVEAELASYRGLAEVLQYLVSEDVSSHLDQEDVARIEGALLAAGFPLPEEQEFEPSGEPAITIDQSVEILKRLYDRGGK